MDMASLSSWCGELVFTQIPWFSVGSAGGLRAKTLSQDEEGNNIEYLNFVTALAARKGLNFHSGDYHAAAKAIGMDDDVATLLCPAGDNNVPHSHPLYEPLAALVEYLAKGEHL